MFTKLDKFEKVIAMGYGFCVYYNSKAKLYYVDLGGPIHHGYNTLQGVVETLYYNDYIPSKDVAALNSANA